MNKVVRTLQLLLVLLLLITAPLTALAYNEAPMLRELVEAGKLPPVEERLPKEPLVLEPLNEIGQYGGTLRSATTEPNTWQADGHAHLRLPYLLWVDRSGSEVVPYFAKGYEFTDENKTLTLYLREGMKWSDGHPFTVDDILFWWEDQILNDELTPTKPNIWKAGGELAKFEKVDDYTLRIRFAAPYRPILSYIAYWGSMQSNMFQPKHYLKKWHIKYNPEANELAKEEGYEFWYQAFRAHADITPAQTDLNLPTLNPWMIVQRNPSRIVLERNPYFCAVDTAGNQLPYIDRIVVDVVERETLVIKATSGELDFAGMSLEVTDTPVLKENEARGNYTVYLWPSTMPAEIGIGFNLAHKDPAFRDIYQDVRFRRAMSLAINREEINDLVFFGQGVPMQATIHPDTSYFKEEWAQAYAQYDPDEANRLLDEMGLNRGPDGWRVRPDGTTLVVTVDYSNTLPFGHETLELVKSYWEDVGVKVSLKAHERSLYTNMYEAGDVGVGVWHLDRMIESKVNLPDLTKFNPKSEVAWGWAWKHWLDTDGAAGEEPSGKAAEAFLAFMDAFKRWYNARSEEEYLQIAEEIWDNQAENLWIIGTVGLSRHPILKSNRLHNFPEECPWGDDMSWWRIAYPELWYLK